MKRFHALALCAAAAIGTACGDSTDPAPPPATQLAFAVQPANDTVGSLLAPVIVAALAANGDTATGFTGPITVALGLNPGNASLSGTLVVEAVAGVATFTALSLDAAEDGYALTATSGQLIGVTSAAFDVSEVVATATMRYEFDAFDLEIGTVHDCGSPGCVSFQSGDDFQIAYNANATPPAVVFQNQLAGATIAHLAGRAFGGVHLADTAGAGFKTALQSDPFDAVHTVLIRTAAGNVFKLGDAVEIPSNRVRFQFARLN